MKSLSSWPFLVLCFLFADVMCQSNVKVQSSDSFSDPMAHSTEIKHEENHPTMSGTNKHANDATIHHAIKNDHPDVIPRPNEAPPPKKAMENQGKPNLANSNSGNIPGSHEINLENNLNVKRHPDPPMPAHDSDRSSDTSKQRPLEHSQHTDHEIINGSNIGSQPVRSQQHDPNIVVSGLEQDTHGMHRPVPPEVRRQDRKDPGLDDDYGFHDRRIPMNEHPSQIYDRNIRADHIHPNQPQQDRYRQPNEDTMFQRHQKQMDHSKIPYEFQLNQAYLLPSVGIRTSDGYQNPSGSDFATITTILGRGLRHCYFYTPVTNFLIDYQVIRGGNLDIGIFVKNPIGVPIAIRNPAPEGTININVPEAARLQPFAICLDNRKASYADKVVYFSIDAEFNWSNPSELEKRAIQAFGLKTDLELAREHANVEHRESVANITNQVTVLRARLRRIEYMQQRSDNWDSIDKALMEANLKRVTTGSLFQVLIMLSVAAIQVGLIRALFDQHSYLHRLWFGKPLSHASARC